MTKRAERAKQTRQKIIDATLELTKQKPFSEISVENITNKSGVAKGSFYTYFPNKEAVIFAIGEEFESLPALEDSDLPFLERLKAYLAEYVHQIMENGVDLSRLWLRYATEIKQKETESKWELDNQLLAKIFNDAIERGELDPSTPVSDFAALLNAQVYGFMTAWCIKDTSIDLPGWIAKIEHYFEGAIEPYLLKK